MEPTFDDQGLVVAIAQDALSGEVRMVAWMNRDALKQTHATGFATFYSRSRQRLWTKGETSGHRLAVVDAWLDCDGDAVLLRVLPQGPSCHTGNESCFFRSLEESVDSGRPLPTLQALEATVEARTRSSAGASYTRSLLDAGPSRISEKLREEAAELGDALLGESDERVVAETADVLYHALVGLRARGVPLQHVLAELERRSGVSGHEEKASRTR